MTLSDWKFLARLRCAVLGHKTPVARVGKKFVTSTCPFCHKQTRKLRTPQMIDVGVPGQHEPGDRVIIGSRPTRLYSETMEAGKEGGE
jgi:hypothetical protein